MRSLLLLILLFSNALLADESVKPLKSCRDVQSFTLYIDSFIDHFSRSSWEEITPQIKESSHLTIILNSPGGQLRSFPPEIDYLSLEEILITLNRFKNKGGIITTILPQNAVCKSACTGILSIADQSIASPGSIISFHSAWRIAEVIEKLYEPPKLKAVVDKKLTGWYLSVLMKNGVDVNWILDNKKKGFFSKTVFTDFDPENLIDAGFVTEIADVDEGLLACPLKPSSPF